MAIIKIPLFLSTLVFYIVISLVVDVAVRNETRKLRWLGRITSFASILALKILGIKVSVVNLPVNKKELDKVFVISNHLSYLDILVYSSVFRSLYITSVEVQNMFFLGLMSRLGGSFFVERRSKTKLLQEIDRIADIIKKGFTVTLFPEGTSSNGDSVLPFKGALFSAAEKAKVPIQPVCIQYQTINGQPLSPSNRDLAYYYGDIEFFPHLIKLFFVKQITVKVEFLEKIASGTLERKELVDSVYTAISDCYIKR